MKLTAHEPQRVAKTVAKKFPPEPQTKSGAEAAALQTLARGSSVDRRCSLDGPVGIRRRKTRTVPGWLLSVFCTLVLLFALLPASAPLVAQVAAGDTLTVMTYNLRYASARPPNDWPTRRPLVAEVIRTAKPDVIGTQEGLYAQLQDLAADLPEFDWIGLGRDGGSRGEFMAVFYRKDRFTPLEYDHFWLSDTPEVVGSTTWGHNNRRMVTWVKFRDQTTKQEFYLFNTHWDHQVQGAREKSAELIRQRVLALSTKLPVLLIGDFNAAAGNNPAYETLTHDSLFRDTWLTARERRGEGVGTFNNFKAAEPNGARIDWILARGPVTTEFSEIITFARDGQFPSDHFPVVTRLRLNHEDRP